MSHVALAEHICEICGSKHTHNTEILIHKQLRDIPEDKRVTGFGLCKEHDALFQKGFLALVGAVPPEKGNRLQIEEAVRTGAIIHIKRELFNERFDAEVPESLPMVFVDDEVVEIVASWVKE